MTEANLVAVEPDANLENPPPLGEVAARSADGGGASLPHKATPTAGKAPSASLRSAPPPEGEDLEFPDWRARMAGDDAKLLGYLARVPSEAALAAQLKQHNDDLKAGRYLKTLPDNPSSTDLADWRRARGVPDAPDGYLDSLPEGLVIGADDRPHVDRFLAEMHGASAPPDAVNAALAAYYDIVEDASAAELERAHEVRVESEAALREQWGAGYTRVITAIRTLLDTLPEAVATVFREGRDASGLPLANNAEMLRWLAGLAWERSPRATLTPGTGTSQASAIADEMAALEAKMGDRRSDYWKGPNAAALQARYVELAEARGR